MDTSDPKIRFDAAGVCNHCTDYFAKLDRLRAVGKAGNEHLSEVVAKIRKAGRGREYDAVLGISGGGDSSFLAFKLKELGIRTLLAHMDNGWNSHQATQNILNVAKATGFDYESFVLDWEEFKDLQLAFLRASVVEAETPTDMAIAGALHRIASKHGVKYIISASNEASEGILPSLWHHDAKDTRYFKFIHKKYGTRKIRHFPIFGFSREVYYKFIRGIKSVYLLNYFKYDKAEALQFLKDEISWQPYGGKHHESHFTKFVQSFLLPTKFNMDYRRATLSTLICAGQVSRTEALEQLSHSPFDDKEVERQKDYVARKLGISQADLNEIIARPGKYYFEYPNNEKWLKRAYSLYRKMFS